MTRRLSLLRPVLLATLMVGAVAPDQASAQAPTAKPVIGIIAGGVATNDPCHAALRRGLEEVGYVDGQTCVLETRWRPNRATPSTVSETYARDADDLVRRNVNVIVALTGAAAAAAGKTTRSIPIVMASSLFPVELGLVASLSRPGGNITGFSPFTPELMAKRVEVLKEAVPAATRLTVLRNEGRLNDVMLGYMEPAARALGIELRAITVRDGKDLAQAFETAQRTGTSGVMMTQGPFFTLHQREIAELGLKHRLATLSGEPGAPEAGTLLFYGPPIFEGCQRASRFVDRILRGAKPADLPVEQPTKLELVINVKTANALGLTVLPSVLLRADRVIQ